MAENSKDHNYIAYWDCLGFECILDITRYENARLIADLAGTEVDPADQIPNLNHMTLRARFNPQRSPQIWAFVSPISRDDLLRYADENPQGMADLIRSVGHPIYQSSAIERKIV